MAPPPVTPREPQRPATRPPGRLTGMTIWRLPEFIAFCDKVGIAHRLPTRRLVIEIPCHPEDCVKITQEYLTPPVEIVPETERQEATVIDTTTQHNEKFKTFQAGTPKEPLL